MQRRGIFGQTRAAIAPAGSSTWVLAALIVTETCPGFMNTHSAMPEVMPINPAWPSGPLGSAS